MGQQAVQDYGPWEKIYKRDETYNNLGFLSEEGNFWTTE